uniref:Putative nuclear pore complex protein nup62 n=1 Tax=Anopheles triannulatus TaxID=58253 RepID=A0A2M4AS00_9DIPT
MPEWSILASSFFCLFARLAAVSLMSSCSSSDEYSRPSWFCSISSPFFASVFCLATPVMIVTPLEAPDDLPSDFGIGFASLFTFRTSSLTSRMYASSGSISSSSGTAFSPDLSLPSSSSSSSSSSSRLHFFADSEDDGTITGSGFLISSSFLFLSARHRSIRSRRFVISCSRRRCSSSLSIGAAGTSYTSSFGFSFGGTTRSGTGRFSSASFSTTTTVGGRRGGGAIIPGGI